MEGPKFTYPRLQYVRKSIYDTSLTRLSSYVTEDIVQVILSSQRGDYEYFRLLNCGALQSVRNLPTFWEERATPLLVYIKVLSYPEDEGSVFLPTIRYLLLHYTVFRPRHVRNEVQNPYETVLYAVSQKWIGVSPLTFKHSGYYIYKTQSPAFTFKKNWHLCFSLASQNTQKLLT